MSRIFLPPICGRFFKEEDNFCDHCVSIKLIPKGENKNSPDHVGIVEKVKDGDITVIEGNKGAEPGKVARRAIKVNGRYIRGFVTPHYDRIKAKVKLKSTAEVAKEVIRGEWGNGAERKKALTASGYDYDAIQKEVNRILKEKENSHENKTFIFINIPHFGSCFGGL
mgnify:CR=1 FL=1